MDLSEFDNDVIVPANTLFCRVCGFPNDEPPWGEEGDLPSFDICVCCGVEWGYEDCTPSSRSKYRKAWAIGGFKWFHAAGKPEGWDPLVQLRNVLSEGAIEPYSAIANTPPLRPFGR